jgi:hypothetical protein
LSEYVFVIGERLIEKVIFSRQALRPALLKLDHYQKALLQFVDFAQALGRGAGADIAVEIELDAVGAEVLQSPQPDDVQRRPRGAHSGPFSGCGR